MSWPPDVNKNQWEHQWSWKWNLENGRRRICWDVINLQILNPLFLTNLGFEQLNSQDLADTACCWLLREMWLVAVDTTWINLAPQILFQQPINLWLIVIMINWVIGGSIMSYWSVLIQFWSTNKWQVCASAPGVWHHVFLPGAICDSTLGGNRLEAINVQVIFCLQDVSWCFLGMIYNNILWLIEVNLADQTQLIGFEFLACAEMASLCFGLQSQEGDSCGLFETETCFLKFLSWLTEGGLQLNFLKLQATSMSVCSATKGHPVTVCRPEDKNSSSAHPHLQQLYEGSARQMHAQMDRLSKAGEQQSTGVVSVDSPQSQPNIFQSHLW